jgi:hypothetical protein
MRALYLITFLLFLSSCSTLNKIAGRTPASVEVKKYSCYSAVAKFITKDRVPSMGTIENRVDPRDYFKKKLSPKKSKSLLRELTVKSKAFHRYLKGLRVNEQNAKLFRLSNQDFIEKLQEHQMYTYVIKDDQIVFAETGPGWHDRLSKHLTLAEKDEIYYGGEMFVVNGKLHMSNASGTYMPDKADLPFLKKFMKDSYGLDIEVPAHGSRFEKRALKQLKQITIKEDLTIEPFEELKRTFSIYKVTNKEGKIIGIFKPEEFGIVNYVSMLDIVAMRRTIEDGGKLKRDISSYELSEAFGFNLVAKTETIDESRARGTAMEFLDGYVTGRKADREWYSKVSPKKVQAMYLFDIVLGHQDRHADNFMLNANGDLKLIDNDLVLHNVEKLRWHNFTNIEELFPHAMGKVDPAVKDKVLSITEEHIAEILKTNGISDAAAAFAINRFRYIKEGIESNRNIEDILSDFDHMAKISCRAMRRECMAKIKKSIVRSTAISAGVGASILFYNYED